MLRGDVIEELSPSAQRALIEHLEHLVRFQRAIIRSAVVVYVVTIVGFIISGLSHS